MTYGTQAGVIAYVRHLANAAGAFSDGTASTLTTALAGASNDLLYTAHQVAIDGDAITVAYVNPGIAATLSVSVVGVTITVNLAHSGAAITSTAALVATAIAAYPAAAILVSVSNAPGSDGTGLVTAMSATHLSGGVNATRPTSTEVTTFLSEASAQLDGWLSRWSYTIPITAPAVAVAILDHYANLGSAGLAELAQRSAGYSAQDQNRRENKFLDEFYRAEKFISSGAFGALGVAQQQAPSGLFGLSVGGKTAGGNALRPMFTRRSFGNNPIAESGPSERESDL